jgi:hypothetical protein
VLAFFGAVVAKEKQNALLGVYDFLNRKFIGI